MNWEKRGLVYLPKGNYYWNKSHAQIPTVDLFDDNIIRIYYSTRDDMNRCRPSFIDVDRNNPTKIIYEHNQPVLDLGKPGEFDDSGIMPFKIVNYLDNKYLFYTGWNVCSSVPYELSIGLAISKDYGKTFSRVFNGPVVGRNNYDPYFCGAPCVLIEDSVWKMWYISCSKWEMINGRLEPFYNIKYTESRDGLDWEKSRIVCIDYDDFANAFGRPCVIKNGALYEMYYSYRNAVDYRTDRNKSYRIGFAISTDGIKWERKDSIVGIEKSDEGWDSQMITYCDVFQFENNKHMFYNGNGFGKSGFGYAVMECKA